MAALLFSVGWCLESFAEWFITTKNINLGSMAVLSFETLEQTKWLAFQFRRFLDKENSGVN